MSRTKNNNNKENDQNYLDNTKFSNDIIAYVQFSRTEREAGRATPQVPNSIGEGFIKIANGLAHRYNFISYTYKEEMVGDAIEDCIRRVHNFDERVPTKSGKVNAFGYFTKIAFFAMVRRLVKEKKEREGRNKLIEQMGSESFLSSDENADEESLHNAEDYIERLKGFNSSRAYD